MLSDLYNFTKNSIRCFFQFIQNLPTLIKSKNYQLKMHLKDFKNRLNNLTETNYNLGLYHLHNKNLNDAIIRFKLIEMFFNPNDSKANYMLGWAYFLKNNPKKAIYYLKKSNHKDKDTLLNFLENINICIDIPNEIWLNTREFISDYYVGKFNSNTLHLPYNFIKKTVSSITNLPDKYSILELGANIGLCGYEVTKRFPDSFNLVGIEISQKMIDLIHEYHNNYKIYDKLICSSVSEFLSKTEDKFDVVLSFCGLAFTRNLTDYFNKIQNLINTNGYFAFCLPISNKTEFSLIRKEFVYNANEVKKLISESSIFTLLHFDEVILTINNRYAIFVCAAK